MRSGKLRDSITFQQRVAGTTSENEAISTWTDWKSWHGDVRDISGSEAVHAKQVHPVYSHEIEIRYCSGLSASTHRVVFGARVFDINAVLDPDGRKRRQLLLCTEVSS